MQPEIEILCCPKTQSPLRIDGARLVSADGNCSYPIIDDIARFLASQASPTGTFYDEHGWKRDADGVFGDTRTFVDTREVPFAFTRRCIRRLNTHFRSGGRFLLDAGSGPIAHDEYLEFGARFDCRICVDLSAEALKVARSKLGDREVYLQADLTDLPIQTASIDAITCNHVIYQIPEDLQASVFNELWRVMKPGAVAVIVAAAVALGTTGANVRRRRRRFRELQAVGRRWHAGQLSAVAGLVRGAGLPLPLRDRTVPRDRQRLHALLRQQRLDREAVSRRRLHAAADRARLLRTLRADAGDRAAKEPGLAKAPHHQFKRSDGELGGYDVSNAGAVRLVN